MGVGRPSPTFHEPWTGRGAGWAVGIVVAIAAGAAVTVGLAVAVPVGAAVATGVGMLSLRAAAGVPSGGVTVGAGVGIVGVPVALDLAVSVGVGGSVGVAVLADVAVRVGRRLAGRERPPAGWAGRAYDVCPELPARRKVRSRPGTTLPGAALAYWV